MNKSTLHAELALLWMRSLTTQRPHILSQLVCGLVGWFQLMPYSLASLTKPLFPQLSLAATPPVNAPMNKNPPCTSYYSNAAWHNISSNMQCNQHSRSDTFALESSGIVNTYLFPVSQADYLHSCYQLRLLLSQCRSRSRMSELSLGQLGVVGGTGAP